MTPEREEVPDRDNEAAEREPAASTPKKARKFKSRAEWEDHMEKQSSGGPGPEWRKKNWIPD